MSNLVDAKVESLSFWHSSYPSPCQGSPRLDEDLEVDVAIVGAGFTGLWTAYYLKTLDPSLSICLLEANFPGFGASSTKLRDRTFLNRRCDVRNVHAAIIILIVLLLLRCRRSSSSFR